MREILFRGKTFDNEWEEGSLHIECGETTADGKRSLDYRILGMRGECRYIDTKTIGQFTGLTDKNGKKIFEGDIIHELDGGMDGISRTVRWDEQYMDFRYPLVRKHWCYGYNNVPISMMRSENTEVIGNIHDNPELLGGA